MNDPQKKYHLGMVSKNILLEGLNQRVDILHFLSLSCSYICKLSSSFYDQDI